jgi:hypothetical protein
MTETKLNREWMEKSTLTVRTIGTLSTAVSVPLFTRCVLQAALEVLPQVDSQRGVEA